MTHAICQALASPDEPSRLCRPRRADPWTASASSDYRGSYYRRVLRMLLTAVAMATLGALPVFLLGAQFVLISDELIFSERKLGLAVGVFFAAAALASAPAGSLVDRLGPRISMILSGGLASLAALGMAVGATSFTTLLVALTIAGFANAALQMTANAALARSIPRGKQGVAFGIKQSAIPFAILVGGLAVPSVGLMFGWRWTYGISAILAGVVALGALFNRTGRAHAPAPRWRGEQAPKTALLITAVATTLANGSATSLGAFLPAWTFKVGMNPGSSGLLLALGAGLCLIGRVVSGVAADRRNGRNMPVVSVQMAIGAVGFLLLAQPDIPLILTGTLIAFGFGWSWPGLLIFAVVRVGRDRPATASSAVQAGGFAGGAFGPPLFGLLIASTSYETGWLVAGAVMLVASWLLLYARRIFLNDLARRPLQ